MSELAPGSVSLEEDQSAALQPEAPPQTPAAPETPPTPQQSAPPVEETEPEGTIVNPNGEKLVPLSALAAKRQEASTAKAQLAEKEAEIAALKDKAAKFDQVSQDWQRVQPLIQQIQQQQTQPQAPKPSAPDPNMIVGEHPVSGKAITLADYTKSLDLWTTGGGLDLERGLEQLGVQRYQAKQQAQQAVQPLYQNTAQQQSALMFERVAALKDKNGVQVDRGVLQRIWGLVPPEVSQNPDTARVLYGQAIAEMLWSGTYKPQQAPPPPPLVTESLGSNGNAPRELTALDRQIATAGQMKTKDYETISANFKPGQTNSLE